MTLLNKDGLKVKFAKDLLEDLTLMDSQVKALNDELTLEDGYAVDPSFVTNYENALLAVALILGNEKSRLEAVAVALHTK